ncbi:ycf54-like protein [Tanacetum coccineum]
MIWDTASQERGVWNMLTGGVWFLTYCCTKGRLVAALGAFSTEFSVAVQVVFNETEGNKKYHFVVANVKFMLDEEEYFQEQLFEAKHRARFLARVEPKFLDKFPNITKRLKRPAIALVSTNGT